MRKRQRLESESYPSHRFEHHEEEEEDFNEDNNNNNDEEERNNNNFIDEITDFKIKLFFQLRNVAPKNEDGIDAIKAQKYSFTLKREKNEWKCESEESSYSAIHISKRGEFPLQLGPFGVTSSELRPNFYETNFQSFLQGTNPLYYYVDFIGNLSILHQYQSNIQPLGTLSRPSPVTLTSETLQLTRIPQSAKYFVWAYPLVGVGSLSDEKKQELSAINNSISFLVYGGFIYFNQNGEIVQVNAIGIGQNLFFSERKWWDNEYTKTLIDQNRFQPITIQSLKEIGALFFCWIAPGEILFDRKKENPKTFGDHGAFVYLFHELDQESAQDCYFSLEDPKETTNYLNAKNNPENNVVSFKFTKQSRRESQAMIVDCIVCRDAIRNVIFGPCSHFVCCDYCSSRLSRCPVCNDIIETKGDIRL